MDAADAGALPEVFYTACVPRLAPQNDGKSSTPAGTDEVVVQVPPAKPAPAEANTVDEDDHSNKQDDTRA